MKVLLLSGLGPASKNFDLLSRSSFDEGGHIGTQIPAFNVHGLWVGAGGQNYPLLRSPSQQWTHTPPSREAWRSSASPHLTTFTLEPILEQAGFAYDLYRLEKVWRDQGDEPPGSYAVVLVSTTFIWNRASLDRLVKWVASRYKPALLVLGGQYSNLKYREIMKAHEQVGFVVRGDAEAALPALLSAIDRNIPFALVPNLVWRTNDGEVVQNAHEYIDYEMYPSPVPKGAHALIPYESMRGCPFSCKFCSFPAASPQWRFKSAEKIVADFVNYRDVCGTTHVRAMDSTFTVPPTRFRTLLDALPSVGVTWEAYTRANAIASARVVDQLDGAHCRSLAVGFESMSDRVLGFMRKQVRAQHNRSAAQLLMSSSVELRASFMVGYPGETPADFRETADYLRSEYSGRLQLYVFSMKDETMPVWEDAARFQLEADTLDEAEERWRHCGMTSDEAHVLQRDTLRDIRLNNPRALGGSWQGYFQSPLAPDRNGATNLAIETLVDRLGMLNVDVSDYGDYINRSTRLVGQLKALGVVYKDVSGVEGT